MILFSGNDQNQSLFNPFLDPPRPKALLSPEELDSPSWPAIALHIWRRLQSPGLRLVDGHVLFDLDSVSRRRENQLSQALVTSVRPVLRMAAFSLRVVPQKMHVEAGGNTFPLIES